MDRGGRGWRGGPCAYADGRFTREDWAGRQFSRDTLKVRSIEEMNFHRVDFGSLRRSSLRGERTEGETIDKKRYSELLDRDLAGGFGRAHLHAI